ncbi:unnamed protein product [Fusarium venenatum]|uniref:Uncharacterized protein n=1 Tax=Fusarium venenatum TaxID=56646 RepID=A0A2L2T3K0_9HYPO|nr:uncharacterized protein FVRRES_00840 [Fusarium venenatum]CEI64328.1 unnamed protein product [Fusarium venenatum]
MDQTKLGPSTIGDQVMLPSTQNEPKKTAQSNSFFAIQIFSPISLQSFTVIAHGPGQPDVLGDFPSARRSLTVR